MRDQRARTGERIRNRRLELGFRSQAAFAKEAGVGARMVAAAETGERIGANTKLRLDRALQWSEGGIDSLLNGHEPVLLEQVQPAPESEMSVDDRLKEIEAGLRDSIRHNRESIERETKFLDEIEAIRRSMGE